jgi:hypothetical protein
MSEPGDSSPRRRRRWPLGAIVLAVALFGAGLGVGALIWSGGSSSSSSRKAAAIGKAGKGPLGDYPVRAFAVFSVGVGTQVTIHGGGAGPQNSNCTRDETVSTFTTGPRINLHPFLIIAKDGGSCATQYSYSNFTVTVKGHGVEGSGRMFLGQHGSQYFSSCYSGVPQDVADHKNYQWSGLSCTKPGPDRQVGDLEIKLP